MLDISTKIDKIIIYQYKGLLQVRVISGMAKGTKLESIDSLSTRPTLDRVKEALFSKINYDLPEAIILDLFSGSGALALESISRGAKKAYLCDSSREAIKIIKQNIEKTRTNDKTILINSDYKKALEDFEKDKIKFDIVFLDPPYKTDFAEDAVKKIIDFKLLSEDGYIILETDNKEKTLENLNIESIKIKDIKKYGRVYLLFLNQNK